MSGLQIQTAAILVAVACVLLIPFFLFLKLTTRMQLTWTTVFLACLALSGIGCGSLFLAAKIGADV